VVDAMVRRLRSPSTRCRSSRRFPAIGAILADFIRSHPSAEWSYGNVYDDDGVTPLLWWETGKID